MNSVSIIIINYNTCQMTSECIDSIFKHTSGIDFELILVDNASTDGSKDFFNRDKRIKYIYSDENLGFGKANNLGVTIANGRNILFLNSDTLLINNAVKILSDYLDRNPHCGICGGNLYDKEEQPSYSFSRSYPSLWSGIYAPLTSFWGRMKFGQNLSFNHTGYSIEVCQISGADLMIKKSVLDSYGGFDPIFFMYYEDAELCCRIKKRGYAIMSVPDAKIKHLCGKSDKMGLSNIWRVESRDNYFKLTGKTKRYRYIDAILRMIHYQLLCLKYCRDADNIKVCKQCVSVCKNLILTIYRQ